MKRRFPSPPPWISQRRHRRPPRHPPRRRPQHRRPRRRASLHPDGSGTRVTSLCRIAGVGAGLVLLLTTLGARAEVAVPPLTARVTDLTGTLSGEAVTRIEAKLANFEARKGSQIVVLIVPTTQPEEIEQFSIRVAEAWKLGRKGVDDGAILIMAKNDRRVRIDAGQGFQAAR